MLEDSEYNPTTEFSVTFWAKISDWTSGVNMVNVSTQSNGGKHVGWSLYADRTGYAKFNVFTDNDDSKNVITGTTTLSASNDDEWIFFCGRHKKDDSTIVEAYNSSYAIIGSAGTATWNERC